MNFLKKETLLMVTFIATVSFSRVPLLQQFDLLDFLSFRPGAAFAASAGPRNPTTIISDSAIGLIPWLNPENAASSNNAYASAALLLGQSSHYLKSTGFGFSIPSDAVAEGILVEVELSANNMAAAVDNAVRIVKSGVIGSTDRSAVESWPTVDTYRSYGGSTDLWGETWTAADINAVNFGFVISARAVGGVNVNVDHIRITVFYNNAPAVSSFSDAPDPVNVGSQATFQIQWNDLDSGERIKVHFCKTNAILPSFTGGSCPGGSWASSGTLNTLNPRSVSYTAQATDAPLITYFAFVCDDQAACSGTTNNSGSINVNRKPTLISFSDSPDPANIGSTIGFSADWDDLDPGEEVKAHFCKTNAITPSSGGGSCPGGTWASSAALSTTDPISLSYVTQVSDFGTNNYYVFVCDDSSGCSSTTANLGTITINSSSIPPPPPPPPPPSLIFPAINIFSALPSNISQGESAVLTWEAKATNCTASGSWDGPKSISGQETVKPAKTGDYVLTCSQEGKIDTRALTITVSEAPQATSTPPVSTEEPEIEKTIPAEILNRETSVKSGGSITILFQTEAGLKGDKRPTLTVYDHNFIKRITNQQMDETDTSGIYKTTAMLDPEWGLGTFVFIASSYPPAIKDAFSIEIVSQDMTVPSKLQAVERGIERTSDTASKIDDLLGRLEILTTAPKVEVEVKIESLKIVVQEVKIFLLSSRKAPGLLETLFEEEKNLEKTETNPDEDAKKEATRNISEAVEAIGRTTKALLQNKKQPIIETFWTSGSVILNLLLTNPADSRETEIDVSIPLPEGIRAEHILKQPEGLRVEYDSVNNRYALVGKVSIPPGGSKRISIEIQDIWQIPEEELVQTKQQSDTFYQRLKTTDLAAQALDLKNKVQSSADLILADQTNLGIEEKIAAFAENKTRMDEARQSLEILASLAGRTDRMRNIWFAVGFGVSLLLLYFFMAWRKFSARFTNFYDSATKEHTRGKEFLSLAAHQLKAPLTLIRWSVEGLLEKLSGKIAVGEKKKLEEIEQARNQMTQLINDFMKASELEVGALAIESKELNITEICRNVLDMLKPQIMEKKLKIQENYPKEALLAKTDPRLITIIFQNILSNAIKYNSNGGSVKIRLSMDQNEHLKTDSGSTRNLLIKITDTGYGIPKEQQSKIFSQFFRADNARQKSVEGTGLGLYLVKKVVDRLSGKIWFESEENKGTTFYISLPLENITKGGRSKN